MIKIENLKKQFGDTIACNIDQFTINDGDILGLVGNNGAGKTTLLRLMLDVIQATRGRVLSNDQDVAGSETWKTFTGSFIDKHFLIDFYTPEEYFTFIAKIYDIPEETLRQRLEEYAPLMNGEILGTRKFLKDFSEGNRQKIGIIGAMMINPKVLLLDEPFNYLDPSSQIIISKLIQKKNQELGTTVLISSHNLNFIADISTRILLLEKGLLVKDLPNHDGSATSELNAYFNRGEE